MILNQEDWVVPSQQSDPGADLWLHEEVVNPRSQDGPGHHSVWRNRAKVAALPLRQRRPAAISTQQLKVHRGQTFGPAGGVQTCNTPRDDTGASPNTSVNPSASSCAKHLTEDVVVKVVMLQEGHVAVASAAGVSDQAPEWVTRGWVGHLSQPLVITYQIYVN